jgi:phosphoribosylaminoimidazole-succinocarboxamide synthase
VRDRHPDLPRDAGLIAAHAPLPQPGRARDRYNRRPETAERAVPTTLLDSDLPGLERVHRGKVRDVYALPENRLLIVATDRLSAFDVVLPDPIPGKGEMLTQISNFWFDRTAHLLPNHLTGVDPASVLPAGVDASRYVRRSVVARRLKALPVEAIARGYLIGSGWKDYQATGAVSGIRLPAGLRQAEQLPEPLFTPSTKAAAGAHDENIDFDQVVALVGADLAEQVRAATLAVYRFAAAFAAGRGILIADTKLEFGLDADGRLRVMDEMLTPDSSRFWPADEYRVGISPPSYDKQFVRDWLETQPWDKTPPGPRLPQAVIDGTAAKYAEALRRLAGIVID